MEKKKVILVNCWMPSDMGLDPLPPHLGLLAIGTFIKKHGYEPVIFDSRKYFQKGQDFWPHLKELLPEALCIGLSLMTAQVDSAVKIASRVKEYDASIPVVWGGFHPSLFPEQTLEDPLVDFIIQGEGDWAFLDLLNAIQNKGQFDNIDGLGYKENGKIVFHPQKKFNDVNELPPWDWSLYDVNPFIKGRTWSDPTEVRQLSIQNSRGCPYRCTFCINTALGCYSRWRAKNVDLILDEIQDLIKNYNIEWLNFRDELFFATRERIVEFCDKLMQRGIKIRWWANARANFFTMGILDDEVMSKMKQAGCVNLLIGIESGSPKMLQFLKKYVTLDQVKASAKMCNKWGITPGYSFIVGLPGETKSDIMMSYKLMKEIMDLCPSAFFLGPHLYRPYPGCELYDISKKFGIPEAKTLREWPNIIDESFEEASDPIERGGYGFDSMPWVYDPKFIKFFIAYARYAVYNPLHLFKTKRYNMALMSIIAKLRFKLNFYGFIGIERKARDTVRNLVVNPWSGN